jgi:integrase
LPRSKFPHVQQFFDRYGKLRFYFRKSGLPRVALTGPYGSPEFLAAYQRALEGVPEPIGAKRTVPGSINALIVSYYESAAYTSLRPLTARTYRNILERFRNEHGAKCVAQMEPRHVRAIMNAKASTPDAANRLLGMISLLMDHAVEIGIRSDNPCVGVKRLRHKSDGHATWAESDIAAFRANWLKGSRERLVFELALNTGQRRGDLVSMGWQHVTGDAIHVRQNKTGARVSIPITPELRDVLDAIPRDRLTFLATSTGAPFTAAGLGNAFRDAVNTAGISSKLALHGLRKAAARRLAEAGCTVHEIASITGHKTLGEIERYTREAENARLARTATAKVIDAFGEKRK